MIIEKKKLINIEKLKSLFRMLVFCLSYYLEDRLNMPIFETKIIKRIKQKVKIYAITSIQEKMFI